VLDSPDFPQGSVFKVFIPAPVPAGEEHATKGGPHLASGAK
jgi:hypothetical protein